MNKCQLANSEGQHVIVTLFKNITQENMSFDFLMEHVNHDNEMINYMMPEDTQYFSSLRHPLMQLKSHLHYTGMDKTSDPVLQFLESKDAEKYTGVTSSLVC